MYRNANYRHHHYYLRISLLLSLLVTIAYTSIEIMESYQYPKEDYLLIDHLV
jgi:hypothetical protein